MKVKIQSGYTTGTGTASDDAPTMDPGFALTIFGVVCHEVTEDGSQGRSINPAVVKVDRWWLVQLDAYKKWWAQRGPTVDDGEEAWRAALFADVRPCEALASRDPGQVRV